MQYMMIFTGIEAIEKDDAAGAGFRRAMEEIEQRLRGTGVWVASERFKPSSNGAVVILDGEDFRIEKGPFPNPDQIIAGYCVIAVATREDALTLARQCSELVTEYTHGQGREAVLLVPCMEFSEEGESEDGSVAPPRSERTGLRRFIGMFKPSPETEAGVMPGQEIFTAMENVLCKLADAGRYEKGGGLMPTSAATRVSFADGMLVVTDGPFAETKELIAGYAIFRASSLDEVIEMSRPGLEIDARWRRGPIVSEVRELYPHENAPVLSGRSQP
ncbi:MAG: YciI family protein [Thermomicrobiales bacterium]